MINKKILYVCVAIGALVQHAVLGQETTPAETQKAKVIVKKVIKKDGETTKEVIEEEISIEDIDKFIEKHSVVEQGEDVDVNVDVRVEMPKGMKAEKKEIRKQIIVKEDIDMEWNDKEGNKMIIIQRDGDGEDGNVIIKEMDGEEIEVEVDATGEEPNIFIKKRKGKKGKRKGLHKMLRKSRSSGDDWKIGVMLDSALDNSGNGALVDGVIEGSPAAKMGLISGDIITGINGEKVTSTTKLMEIMEKLGKVEQVKIEYMHNGEKQEKKVSLKS